MKVGYINLLSLSSGLSFYTTVAVSFFLHKMTSKDSMDCALFSKPKVDVRYVCLSSLQD
jgi:hypothetical protein